MSTVDEKVTSSPTSLQNEHNKSSSIISMNDDHKLQKTDEIPSTQNASSSETTNSINEEATQQSADYILTQNEGNAENDDDEKEQRHILRTDNDEISSVSTHPSMPRSDCLLSVAYLFSIPFAFQFNERR